MDFLLRESPVPYNHLYLDGDGMFVVLDEEDYAWAVRSVWRPKPDKHGRKFYAVRNADVGADRGANRRQASLFLHKVICLRRHGPPPSPRHTIADHKNGNSLDCRLNNLRWATARQNRENVGGWFARQMALDLPSKIISP